MQIIASQTYTQFGKLIKSQKNFSNNGLKSNELVAVLTDKYYRKMNQFPNHENGYRIGFGPFVAITETIAAFSLVWCFRSIATVINLLTTLGEFGQSRVAQIDPNKSSKNQLLKEDQGHIVMNGHEVKRAIESKESGMAWFQLFAGTGGLAGLAYEFLSRSKKDENISEVPFLGKIVLSASSALNAFFMLIAAGEKSLMSMLSKNGSANGNKHIGVDYNTIRMDKDSDLRCTAEWGIMTIVPWISNIDFLKHFVDIAVTYGAIREGLDYFKDTGRMNLTIRGKQFLDVDLRKRNWLMNLFRILVNPFSLFKKDDGLENDSEKFKICWPFNKALNWFLGAENDLGGKGASGFRNRIIVPMLRNFFGCDPFNAYLEGEKNIVCEFSEQKSSQKVSKAPENNTCRKVGKPRFVRALYPVAVN